MKIATIDKDHHIGDPAFVDVPVERLTSKDYAATHADAISRGEKAHVERIEAGDELTEELLAFCREHLSRQKVPRSIDYEDELPRLPTGKLYKRLLRDRYWGEGTNKIV